MGSTVESEGRERWGRGRGGEAVCADVAEGVALGRRLGWFCSPRAGRARWLFPFPSPSPGRPNGRGDAGQRERGTRPRASLGWPRSVQARCRCWPIAAAVVRRTRDSAPDPARIGRTLFRPRSPSSTHIRRPTDSRPGRPSEQLLRWPPICRRLVPGGARPGSGLGGGLSLHGTWWLAGGACALRLCDG